MPPGSEFDKFADDYEQLLADPIRERFTADAAFFHERKAELIHDFFRSRNIRTVELAYLDVGCGRGELVKLLRPAFGQVASCDTSREMMRAGGLTEAGIDARLQDAPGTIPFHDGSFDFATAVCVFHHVPPPLRGRLLTELRRVLKPGGRLAIIEHNPLNPATRIIVSRTPVDRDAILLRRSETIRLMGDAGMRVEAAPYFLYLPQKLYRLIGGLERRLAPIPLGGQYAVFARVPELRG